MNKIVILGAGYGGLLATLRLGKKAKEADITLINASEYFVRRIQLHQVATGQDVPKRAISELLDGKPVSFIKGWVTEVQPAANCVCVRTESGTQQIEYDYLVYALGSYVNRDVVPGAEEHTYTLDPNGARGVYALRDRLHALKTPNVVVVGGGPTGIETASEIKDVYPVSEVSIYTAEEFGRLPGKESIQDDLKRGVRALGITIHEHSPVQAIQERHLVLENDQQVRFDLCVWAGGFIASPIAQNAGLAVNQQRQILIDPYMRSISHPNIFALGDAAHPVEHPGADIRMSIYAAVVTGLHTADCLSRQLRGKQLKPLSFAYMGQGIGMGSRNAVAFSSFPDDTPKYPFVFTGRAGYYMREFFVWFLNALIPLEAMLPGLFFWLGRGRYRKFQGQSQHSHDTQQTV